MNAILRQMLLPLTQYWINQRRASAESALISQPFSIERRCYAEAKSNSSQQIIAWSMAPLGSPVGDRCGLMLVLNVTDSARVSRG